MSRLVRGRTAVVTDSTAALAPEMTGSLGVTVVPMQVMVDGRSYEDGVDLGPAEVAAALWAGARLTTSRPASGTFAAAYARLAAAGATDVVSVHISGSLSGTADSARDAARTAGLPVTVVDSRSLGLGLGFAVLAAAEAAEAGAALDVVAEVALRTAAATPVLFYVDTLEHLRRGGRIGAAARLLGSALSVKPLLRLEDGAIVPLEKVRTAGRALARLEDLAAETAGDRDVDLGVHHLASPERASALATRLAERLPRVHDLHVVEVGAAIGAHAGPGLLAVAVAPA